MSATNNFTIKSLSPLLLVSNLEQAISFYHQLGFETSFIYEDFYAELKKDGFTIHLKHGQPRRRVNPGEEDDLDINMSVTGIREFYDAVQKLDVNIIQPLREMPYGWEFYIADLDGNLLGMVES
jgi:predicted enzyme related to lactoylglutathione lyase